MNGDGTSTPAAALLLPEVLELLRASPEAVGEALSEAHSADISTLVESMREPERRALFAALPPGQAATAAGKVGSSEGNGVPYVGRRIEQAIG